MFLGNKTRIVPSAQSSHFCGVQERPWQPYPQIIFFGEADSQTRTCDLSLNGRHASAPRPDLLWHGLKIVSIYIYIYIVNDFWSNKLFSGFSCIGKLSYLVHAIISCNQCCCWLLFIVIIIISIQLQIMFLITYNIHYYYYFVFLLWDFTHSVQLSVLFCHIFVFSFLCCFFIFLGEDNQMSCGKYRGRHIIQPTWRIVHSLLS